MTGTIRVTPETLISTAQSFSSSATTVQNLTASMLETVRELKGTWGGEAAITYYNQAEGLQPSINKIVGMITEHSNDLQSMAKVMQEAERKAREAAGALKPEAVV